MSNKMSLFGPECSSHLQIIKICSCGERNVAEQETVGEFKDVLSELQMFADVLIPVSPASLVKCWCLRTLSTFALVLADVSTYWTPHSLAFAAASSAETCRRSSRSDLFPTRSRGIASSSFTRRICSLTHTHAHTLSSDPVVERQDLTDIVSELIMCKNRLYDEYFYIKCDK